MNEINHKEIDVLLKKLGQSDQGDLDEVSTPHLDADELSAFAENSLPEKARAFYADHLADCVDCRKLVTSLHSAAGFVIEKTQTSTDRGSRLAKILGSTLPWFNLRFAIPTLAAVAVLVIAVVLIRQNQRTVVVPQLAQIPARTDERPSIVTSSDQTAPVKPNESSPGVAKERTDKEGAAGEKSVNGPVSDRDAIQSEERTRKVDNFEKKEEKEPEKLAANSPQPATVATPKAADEVSVGSSDVASKRSLPSAGRSVAELEDQKAATKQQPKAEAAQPASAPARQEAESGGATGSFAINPVRRAANQKAKDSEAETRSVAGHQFRKAGRVWTDERYDPGSPTIDFVRGSEQFRALIADEPQIATIASQLSGDVIVVWKGRAYHIK